MLLRHFQDHGANLVLLTPLHKHLVRRTFTRLVIDADEVLRLFRQRLGETNPLLLSLVLVETQPYRPMEMLALIISLLDHPQVLSTKLKMMQAQQPQELVSGENLRQLGDVLLWVVEQEIGDGFTAETQTAWLEFYRYLVYLSTSHPEDLLTKP